MGNWDAISDIACDVQAGKTSAKSLSQKAIEIIESKQEYKSVISILSDNAISRATGIDNAISSGKKVGRLAGVPFIAKDNFLTFGEYTTAASNMLKQLKAPYQATAIEKLEAEGAICVAKANLDAFAHGSSTENSDFFTTLNPHDKSRVPGGSSGGSAAAVALDCVPFALGTDTGGSIRLPAAFCGVVGYKPTYGLVSRSGVIAMASSTDVIGPLTRTVADAALVLDVMSGKDTLDSTTIERDKELYTKLDLNPKGKRIGVVKEYMDEDLAPEIRTTITNSLDKLKEQGVIIEEVSIPSLSLALACYYIICPAEVSSNLNRYDGQRFGYSNPEATDLDESYVTSRSKGFGAEAKRRIMIGTHVLSSGYYDAYYRQAQLVRTKLINEFNQAFAKVDYLVGPTAASTAFKVGENTKDPLKMYLKDLMTVAANLTGIPAISLPVGKHQGLPIGMQFMTPQHQDRALLGLAKITEEQLA